MTLSQVSGEGRNVAPRSSSCASRAAVSCYSEDDASGRAVTAHVNILRNSSLATARTTNALLQARANVFSLVSLFMFSREKYPNVGKTICGVARRF